MELKNKGLTLVEMTLQGILKDMAVAGQIVATRKGRETIYSLPSNIQLLREFEISLMQSIEIRKHVREVFLNHLESGNYPTISKVRYLEGNLKFLFNDLNRLMVLEALKGKKGLYQKVEDNLLDTLKDLLLLAGKDEKDRDEVLSMVVSSLLDPRSLLRSAEPIEFWPSPAALPEGSKKSSSKKPKN